MKQLALALLTLLWIHLLFQEPKSSPPVKDEDNLRRLEGPRAGRALRLQNTTRFHVEFDGRTTQISSGSLAAPGICPYDPGGSERLLGRPARKPELHSCPLPGPEQALTWLWSSSRGFRERAREPGPWSTIRQTSLLLSFAATILQSSVEPLGISSWQGHLACL